MSSCCEAASLAEGQGKSKWSLSFSGCGFLVIYHAGVCAAIKEYAPQLLSNQVSGASAGSIIAACLVSNVCISQTTSLILNVVTQARSHTFGALDRDFDLMEVVRRDLNLMLPENAHELCTGKLRISVTRFSDMKNVIISEFRSKAELIQAIICSSFIPVYGGFVYPTFRGETYIDGGVTDNQPTLDAHTITVSPFAGENDICPPDGESASMFDFLFSGTSVRYTANNLYRLMVCLFPPPTDVCSRMCRQGFEDALKYLIENGLAPCARCLTVQADFVGLPSQQPANYRRQRLKRYSSTSTIASNDATSSYLEPEGGATLTRRSSGNGFGVRGSSECESCCEKVDPRLKPQTSSLFPKHIEKQFEIEDKDDEPLFLNFFSSKVMQMAHVMSLPFMATLQVVKFCKSMSSWLTGPSVNDWLADRIGHFIKFLINELDFQQCAYSARLTRQLAITEIEYGRKGHHPSHREQLLQVELSTEASKEYDILRRKDILSLRGYRTAAEQAIPPKVLEEDEAGTSVIAPHHEDDSLSHVVDYAREHDAILAYYYMDDTHHMRVCEIFGMDHPQRRHTCHSHLRKMGYKNPEHNPTSPTTPQ